MKISCDLAQGNKDNKIECTVNHQLCTYQRYCAQASEWQNTGAASSCERRVAYMSKNYNKPQKHEAPEIIIIDPIISEPETPEEVETVPTHKGKIIAIMRDGCIITDENDQNVQLFGLQYTQLKVGDEIEL